MTQLTIADPAAWAPHEGGLLRMRADIRFGADGLPDGWWFGRVSAVATDAAGLVYVAHRGPAGDPVVVLDPSGKYVRSWGRGHIERPHGLRVAPDGGIWVTDVARHEVTRWDPGGQLTLSLGTAGVAGADDRSFDMPTDIAFGPSGDVYISDGYGNSRVVRCRPDGQRVASFGTRGAGSDQLHTPHALVFGPDGRLFLSDRTNGRVRILDPDFGDLGTWHHLGATQGIDVDADGSLWVVTYRSTLELVAQDSLGGRLMHLDGRSGAVLASVDANGHTVHRAASGDIFVASLSGCVIRFWASWPEDDGELDEKDLLAAPATQ